MRASSSTAHPKELAGGSTSRRMQGPTLPSASDITLAREAEQQAQKANRVYERQRSKKDARDRIDDAVGPKEVGKEALLEKKRAKRENDRDFRDAKGDDGGGDWDEGTMMGGGDSFQAKSVSSLMCLRFGLLISIRLAQRDAAKKRAEERKQSFRDEKGATIRDRQDAMREKEKQTMEMLRKMAREHFG